MSLDSGNIPPIWKDAYMASVYKKLNAPTLPTTGTYPLLVFFVIPYNT